MKVTLLSYSVINDCCKLQRTLWPLQALNNMGKIDLTISYLSMIPLFALNKEKRKELLDCTDVLIIQRPTTFMSQIELFLELVEKEKPSMSIIFEYDDWLWTTEEIMDMKYLLTKYPIICSTLTLGKSISTIAQNAKIFIYNTKMVILDDFVDQLPFYNSNTIIHTGTRTHLFDLEEITDGFKDFMINNGESKIHFWGNTIPSALLKYKNRVEQIGFISDYTIYSKKFMEYPARIGINPLAKTRKNWCKSGIKYIEYGIKGIPALFQRMPEYERIVPDDLGFLLFETEEFEEKLDALYNMTPAVLNEIGMRMRDDVLENHIITEEGVLGYLTLLEKCNKLNLGGNLDA